MTKIHHLSEGATLTTCGLVGDALWTVDDPDGVTCGSCRRSLDRQHTGTQTSAFGVGKREGHDASGYYGRRMTIEPVAAPVNGFSVPAAPVETWADRVYCASSEHMAAIPDASVGLAFTSPPYNVGKEYDADLSLDEYLGLIAGVARDVWRVLVPGGRYVVNVANAGRKPYIPLTAHFHYAHKNAGFLPVGEVIWQKAAGAGGNCAWGSWKSAKAPSLRDVHEYLLVFTKERFGRPDRGVSDIEREDFMASTLSIWNIRPESAKRVGHPAPFPVALAERVIRLWSYVGDVVLDPFVGSGTTCVAAKKLGRRFVGYDISEDYCARARQRIGEV